MRDISKQKEIIVEKARPEDARGMQVVFYETWLATYPNQEYGITIDDIHHRYKDYLSEAVLEKRRERLANPRIGEMYWFAKNKGQVVGVCRTETGSIKNEITAIYVLPAFQGAGIGRALWLEAQKNFDTSKPTFVDVVSYNHRAIAFYEKLGFKDTGERFTNERFRMKNGALLPEMRMILEVR